MEADADAKLDDVMLAMDVVDTLRHERMLITRDINSEVRRETLVDRLREIYRGQGITVPDDILMDGVRALEEERFRYAPPPDGFGTKLARLYVNRRRWLPLTTIILAIIALVPAINYFGFERPATVAAETQISQTYALEIIQPNEGDPGFFYDLPDGERLYYVTVDAVGPDGDAVRLDITDQITGRAGEVSRFAVQVPESVYTDLAADIAADGDVDAITLGTKASGETRIDFSVPVQSGRLLDFPGAR